MRKTGQATGTHGSVHKKLAAKEDLKMTDLLAYYSADTGAAKDLMTRRVKAFNEMQRTDKALAAAKLKGKKVFESQEAATQAKAAFEAITKTATEERFPRMPGCTPSARLGSRGIHTRCGSRRPRPSTICELAVSLFSTAVPSDLNAVQTDIL